MKRSATRHIAYVFIDFIAEKPFAPCSKDAQTFQIYLTMWLLLDYTYFGILVLCGLVYHSNQNRSNHKILVSSILLINFLRVNPNFNWIVNIMLNYYGIFVDWQSFSRPAARHHMQYISYLGYMCWRPPWELTIALKCISSFFATVKCRATKDRWVPIFFPYSEPQRKIGETEGKTNFFLHVRLTGKTSSAPCFPIRARKSNQRIMKIDI